MLPTGPVLSCLFAFTCLTGVTQSKAKMNQFDAQILRSGERIPNCTLFNQAVYGEEHERGRGRKDYVVPEHYQGLTS